MWFLPDSLKCNFFLANTVQIYALDVDSDVFILSQPLAWLCDMCTSMCHGLLQDLKIFIFVYVDLVCKSEIGKK